MSPSGLETVQTDLLSASWSLLLPTCFSSLLMALAETSVFFPPSPTVWVEEGILFYHDIFCLNVCRITISNRPVEPFLIWEMSLFQISRLTVGTWEDSSDVFSSDHLYS